MSASVKPKQPKMKNVKLLAAAALCVSFSSLGSAEDAVKDNDYFKTSAVTVTSEETVRDLTEKDLFPMPLRLDQKVAAAAIVNGGVQAWNVINSGKPDASLSSSYASAIPGFSFNWANFSGWKKKEVVYTYTVTNLMQIDVIKIKYAVSFFYNGQNLAVQGKPGTDPISSDSSIVQSTSPRYQCPRPEISVSGTACAISDPTIFSVASRG